MTVRRKRALARGARSTIFEVCLSTGVLISLWWGIKHPEHVAGCARPANHVQHCISNTIGTVASHWALTLGAGAIIGALAGAALASLIPRG